MRFTITTIALAPLLWLQGTRTRRRTPRLPEPDGARSGIVGTGPDLRLLIVGDSAAAGVGAAHQDEALLGQLLALLRPHYRVQWRLLAETGTRTDDWLGRLAVLPGERWDVVLTSLGVNDVTALVPLDRWLRQQARLRRLLRERFGVSRLLISGLPPLHGFPALPQPLRWHLGGRATQFDRALRRALAAEPDCHYLDLRFAEDLSLMAADGFHPGPGVYREWARFAAERILRDAHPANADPGNPTDFPTAACNGPTSE
jgi:lysophospholipase L1-like esterase